MEPSVFEVPSCVKAEHAELQASLERARRYPGKVGEAAGQLAACLRPHLVHEAQLALPPLGLLAPLARGEPSPGMSEILLLVDTLRLRLPELLAEHEAARAAAQHLERVARAARAADIARFAHAFLNHMRFEEEVLYPAALLVGDLIRSRETVPA